MVKKRNQIIGAVAVAMLLLIGTVAFFSDEAAFDDKEADAETTSITRTYNFKWNDDYTACAIDDAVDGQDFRAEIALHKDTLQSFTFEDGACLADDCSHIFEDAAQLRSVTFDPFFHFYHVHNAAYMFKGCSSLAEISPFNSFMDSNFSDITSMFEGCSSLTSLDLSEIKQPETMRMQRAFKGCSSLQTLNISWIGDIFENEEKNLTETFEGCTSLSKVVLFEAFIFSYLETEKGINYSGFPEKAAGGLSWGIQDSEGNVTKVDNVPKWQNDYRSDQTCNTYIAMVG